MMVLKSFKAYALELFFAFERPINISSTNTAILLSVLLDLYFEIMSSTKNINGGKKVLLGTKQLFSLRKDGVSYEENGGFALNFFINFSHSAK